MVIYGFASTTSNSSVLGLEFVETAHANGVLALLSVGGFGGSQFFSTAVATDANQTAFAQAVMNVVTQYGLDGVELDWEYPAKQGIGCNTISTNDSANFLSFLQTLRSQEGANELIITAAVTITTFVGSDGNPMANVSAFAEVLDYIEVMNYDVWGSWSPTVGPNAPLNDSCAPTADQQGSAVSAINNWSKAGFPTTKMILGVPSYGHSFHVNQSTTRGGKWDSTAGGTDQCGNPNVVAGFLTNNGTAASGINYIFDNCSQTPYVYNSTSQVMVSYDDATSFGAKGQYIKEAGLAGFAMWETGGDSNDILLNAINSAIGIGC
ncbi:glycoside hydrolase superfamily [Lactarius quietus]|nr:glycoside hydrolase superfamily [Lactarius quietus]